MSVRANIDAHNQATSQQVHKLFDTHLALNANGVLVAPGQGDSVSFVPQRWEVDPEASPASTIISAGGTVVFHILPGERLFHKVGITYKLTKGDTNVDIMLPGPLHIDEVTIRGNGGGAPLQTLKGETMLLQKRMMTPKDNFTVWATAGAGFVDATDNVGLSFDSSPAGAEVASYVYSYELTGSLFEQLGLYYAGWHSGFMEVKITFRAGVASAGAGTAPTCTLMKLWMEGVEVSSEDHASFKLAAQNPKGFLIHDTVVQQETWTSTTSVASFELKNFVGKSLTNLYVILRSNRVANAHNWRNPGLLTTTQLIDETSRKQLGEQDPTLQYTILEPYGTVPNLEGLYLADGTAANVVIPYPLGHATAHWEGKRHGGMGIKPNYRIQLTCASDPSSSVLDIYAFVPMWITLDKGLWKTSYAV